MAERPMAADPVRQHLLVWLNSLLPAPPCRVLWLDAGSMQRLPRPEQPWQVLVLCDALQGASLLDLFEAADRLCVAQDAEMLVLDRFAPRHSAASSGAVPVLDEFRAMARRCGWRVWQEQDPSEQRGPGLPEQTQALSQRLLRLRRAHAPTLRLARVGASESVAMRILFERVFGHPMSAAEWAWKYGAGHGVAVGLYRGTEMLAHYGGLARPVLLMGRPALGCQVGDVMVAPEANAGLGRRLPLHDVAATLLEAEIGWGRRHDVGFGFPNSRHMRVAERLGLYAAVDGITQLEWLALPQEHADHVAAESVEPGELLEGTVQWQWLQQLWGEMAAALTESAVGVRDPGWLRYRYGQRPGVRYPMVLLHTSDRSSAAGAVVLRAHADRLEVMDLIAAPAQFPRLLRLARAHAGALGLERVQMWVTQSHAGLMQDPADPARADVLDVTIPANVHTPGMAPAELKNRWFLTGGDTDFR